MFFVEGDTGDEGTNIIIEKIGNYYFKNVTTLENNKYVFFSHKKCTPGFYNDNFTCLLETDTKQAEYVYKLLEYYGCTLDELIIILEEYFNADNVINGVGEFNQSIFKQIVGNESEKFIEYKMMKCLLCAKSARFLLSCEWIYDKFLDIKNISDSQKIQILIKYLKDNKYSNNMQYYIDCKKNIEDTRDRRLSIAKAIIDRYDIISNVWAMRDALNSIFSGVEMIMVPACICEVYIPYFMEKESEQIYQKFIKSMLEKQYGHTMTYVHIGAPFSTIRNISDLFLRHCYYYISEDNRLYEIYVENISASLSAMVRVATLINELLCVSLEGRNCTVICMVDSITDMQAFQKMLIKMNRKYNNATRFKVSIYYLLYDDIKQGRLLSCDVE